MLLCVVSFCVLWVVILCVVYCVLCVVCCVLCAVCCVLCAVCCVLFLQRQCNEGSRACETSWLVCACLKARLETLSILAGSVGKMASLPSRCLSKAAASAGRFFCVLSAPS